MGNRPKAQTRQCPKCSSVPMRVFHGVLACTDPQCQATVLSECCMATEKSGRVEYVSAKHELERLRGDECQGRATFDGARS